MSEIILHADPKAKDLFDGFAAEHPEQSEVVTEDAFDGTAVVTLLIENAASLSASLALLIAAVKGRNLKVRVTRDGLEVDSSEAVKPN